ncbi:MAG: hypothetical protein ABJV04_02735 [Aliiglaciecola sp.]|uniref:hypothetical protein n=1 Tax=Aliiglaciecola sp. TaxID=1872441 RepID=UPI0032998D04
MSLFKTLKSVTAICLLFNCLLATSTSVSAHVLSETSAQVILRDGQVEVKLLADMDHLIMALQSEQAWLMGDIDSVMPNNLSSRQQDAFIANALKQHTKLAVNGEALAFETVKLQSASGAGERWQHGREIVFRGRHSFAKVSELSIYLHKSLGTVHISVVKPQYRLLTPGETGQIRF